MNSEKNNPRPKSPTVKIVRDNKDSPYVVVFVNGERKGERKEEGK